MSAMRYLAALVLIGSSMSANAGITVQISTSFSEAVLADVCSARKIDTVGLRESEELQTMLTHFSQFRDYFTMDAYLEARQMAADCEKNPRDIFRFNQVIDERASLTQELQSLSRDLTGRTEEVSAMLQPYVPADLSYLGSASIMIGTPSCGGWSSGSSFYLDLPCLRGDVMGMQFLVVHESYHGMQKQFMPENDSGDLIQRLLGDVLREGSATYLADFRTITEPGYYAGRSQQTLKTNDSRAQQNFDLLDISVAYLAEVKTEEAFRRINNIGLSGLFDSPFYSVGESVVRAIADAYGNSGLVCLLQAPAGYGFTIYHSLTTANPELPGFGPVLLEWLESNVVNPQSVLTACEAEVAARNKE